MIFGYTEFKAIAGWKSFWDDIDVPWLQLRDDDVVIYPFILRPWLRLNIGILGKKYYRKSPTFQSLEDELCFFASIWLF